MRFWYNQKKKAGVFMKAFDYFKDLPDVDTKHLRLRKITLEDAEDLFYYGSVEEVTQNVTWYPYKKIKEAKDFIRIIWSFYEAGEAAPWAIEHKETGKMIGTIGFGNVEKRHFSAEVAYVLSKDYWGKGYTTEAVRELIRIGFEELDFIRISAQCLTKNKASARVMQKAGMTYEGTLRKVAFIKGKNRDLKTYSILHEEYFS